MFQKKKKSTVRLMTSENHSIFKSKRFICWNHCYTSND